MEPQLNSAKLLMSLSQPQDCIDLRSLQNVLPITTGKQRNRWVSETFGTAESMPSLKNVPNSNDKIPLLHMFDRPISGTWEQ